MTSPTVPRRTAVAVLRALNGRRLRAVSQLLLLAAIVFVVLRLRSTWRNSNLDLGGADWTELAAAVVVSAAGLASMGFIWVGIVRRLGGEARNSFVGIFFQTQLSKYIPGGVWQYAGRTTLAASNGVPLRVAVSSLGIEVGAQLGAAGATALLLLGTWGLLPFAAAITSLIAMPRLAVGALRASRAAAARAFGYASALYCGTWSLMGVGLWFVAASFFGVGLGDLFVYTGAFALAWAVGLLAVYAPGGLGVREAMLVVLLRGRLGTADALVLAALSRVLLTALDLAAGLVGAAVVRSAGRRAASRPPRARYGGRSRRP